MKTVDFFQCDKKLSLKQISAVTLLNIRWHLVLHFSKNDYWLLQKPPSPCRSKIPTEHEVCRIKAFRRDKNLNAADHIVSFLGETEVGCTEFLLDLLLLWATSHLSITSHLSVKRERPLIITYSPYSKDITRYHFCLKHVRKEEQRWSC